MSCEARVRETRRKRTVRGESPCRSLRCHQLLSFACLCSTTTDHICQHHTDIRQSLAGFLLHQHRTIRQWTPRVRRGNPSRKICQACLSCSIAHRMRRHLIRLWPEMGLKFKQTASLMSALRKGEELSSWPLQQKDFRSSSASPSTGLLQSSVDGGSKSEMYNVRRPKLRPPGPHVDLLVHVSDPRDFTTCE